MRSNRKILFGLSMILGAFLLYRGFIFLSRLSGPPRPVAAQNGVGPGLRTVSAPAPTGRIAQAAVDIPANSIVTPDMLRLVPYSGPSTRGFITDIEAQGAGFITRRPIPAGGQIRPDEDFVGHVSDTGIAGLLRPGTRAMIVPIANKPTLHDLVRIGNFIDVLAAFDGQESRTLVEDVRVLGVDVSAGDYPNVNAAMRGPFKAAPKTALSGGDAAPGASAPGASTPGAAPNPQPNSAGPTPAPTAVPANVPRPDPALILEVTPRQAASIQLALASNAPLDFLVRPALPSNRSTELAPVANPNAPSATIITSTGASGPAVSSQAVSVTKPQIAPYAEARKAAGAGGKGGAGKGANPRSNRSFGGDAGGASPRLKHGGLRPLESVPSFPGDSGPVPLPPASVVSSVRGGTSNARPEVVPVVPAPPQTYTIPVYGDGKILRQETVPLPSN